MTIAKGRYRKIPIIAAKLNWADLHPAPVGRAVPDDRNCCECLHIQITSALTGIGYRCNLQGKPTNPYDECGAFSKRIEKSVP